MTEKPSLPTLTNVEHDGSSALTAYERASTALAEARSVDEVLTVRDRAEQMRLYGRQAQDRNILANAMEIQLRAERRLGEMVIEGKQSGLIGEGRPSTASRENRSDGEQFQRVTLAEVGVNRKLSSKAQKLAEVPEEQFREVVERAREKVLSGGAVVVNPMKDLNTADKKVMRAVREAQLAAKQKALPEKKFGVILADPEWPFDVWSAAGMDRSPDNHYPTSALEIIGARDVPKISADDCVLFLWVTAPHHAAGNGAMIMRAWGFEPKAETIWDKVEVGTGFWFRNRHEILIVGTRGSVPAPAMGTQWPSIVSSPRGVHSEKPDWSYELIEDYFPSLGKIELNARTRREGWDAWGFEAPDDEIKESRTEAGVQAQPEPHGLGSSPAGAGRDADRQSTPAADTSGAASPGVTGAGEGGDRKHAPDAFPGTPDDPVEAYQFLIERAEHLRGRHTQGSIESILRAGVAANITGAQMALDTDSKLGSILGWKGRLGLTGLGTGRSGPRPRQSHEGEEVT